MFTSEKKFIQQNIMAVANAFIDQGIMHDEPLDHLKLQKLCYLAQAWHIGFTNQMFFSNDIQAWRYGPVIPDLYTELSHYGKEVIKDKIAHPFNHEKEFTFSPGLENYCESLIQWVWKKYSHLDGVQLSDLTHQSNSPWSETVSEFGYNKPIQPDMIAAYYQKSIEQLQAA